MSYVARTTRTTIAPEGEPTFSELATHIEVEDTPAGSFLLLAQNPEDPEYQGKIAITPEDWPIIRQTIDAMIAEIEEKERDEKP